MSKHPRTNSPRSDLVRHRAEKLAALGDLLVSGASGPWSTMDIVNEQQGGIAGPVARAPLPTADSSADAPPSGMRGVPAAAPTDDVWQRRQIEILSRIDENLRRLRLHQESPRDVTAVFTEPAF